MRWKVAINPANYAGQTVVASEVEVVSIDEVEKLEARIQYLELQLRSIAALGGNLSDQTILSIGGVNDGKSRALMYAGARTIARAALEE